MLSAYTPHRVACTFTPYTMPFALLEKAVCGNPELLVGGPNAVNSSSSAMGTSSTEPYMRHLAVTFQAAAGKHQRLMPRADADAGRHAEWPADKRTSGRGGPDR